MRQSPVAFGKVYLSENSIEVHYVLEKKKREHKPFRNKSRKREELRLVSTSRVTARVHQGRGVGVAIV